MATIRLDETELKEIRAVIARVNDQDYGRGWPVFIWLPSDGCVNRYADHKGRMSDGITLLRIKKGKPPRARCEMGKQVLAQLNQKENA